MDILIPSIWPAQVCPRVGVHLEEDRPGSEGEHTAGFRGACRRIFQRGNTSGAAHKLSSLADGHTGGGKKNFKN